ncbi:MAG: response regulator, partial [Desulfobulbaceae bacterium]|nr:response regulator [Desulfobulbaceae bacterium]
MTSSYKNEPRQHHILVVDDDEGIRQMLQELFTKEGFLCAVAEDGEKALARMQDREFDVV